MVIRRFSLCLLVAIVPVIGGCVAAAGAGVGAGVSAYHDNRSAGAILDDQLIELKAYDSIRDDPELRKQGHINVTSVNNIVLLTGEVPSEAMRTRLAERMQVIPKVRLIHNEVVVAAPSSILSRSSDTWITGKVKNALLQSAGVSATRVKVVTENGIVYLMGLVGRKEAEAATDTSRRVDGVQRVVKVFEYVD